MGNIYMNRENISMINKIRAAWGFNRSAQTNSRHNGNYGRLRLYALPEYKGKRNAPVLWEANDAKTLREMIAEIS